MPYAIFGLMEGFVYFMLRELHSADIHITKEHCTKHLVITYFTNTSVSGSWFIDTMFFITHGEEVQGAEWVFQRSDGHRFKSHAKCRSIFEQDTELHLLPAEE